MFLNRLNGKCQVRIIFISLLVGISTLTHAEDLLDLPDPLITNGGETVDSTTVWRQERRPEILELFRTHVYGRAPVGRPAEMTFEVLETDDTAVNGTATRKQIRVHLTGDSGRPYMDILIYLPNNQPRPVKLFIGLNFMGNHTIHEDEDIVWTDNWTPWGTGDRGSESSLWPVESILNRGYGVATIHCADLDPDRPDGFNDGVHGAFDPPGDRPDDAWGTVGAWAWGLSRAMDYFETDQDIDHAKVAVLGHSRLGKTALWAGAQDERFSIVISNDSGCTGAALSRRMQGETVAQINAAFPHWFCENYKGYNNNEDALPVDQHMLIALMAPRPVYIASAENDSWADPEGEFLSGVHAAPVYELFGLTGLETTVMPPPDQPINDGHIGYHLRTGNHDLTAYDWECFMDYADKYTDPNNPTVVAGDDKVTWSGELVQLTPNVVYNGPGVLTYHWTAFDPNNACTIEFDPPVNPADPNTSAALAPLVTITKATGDAVTVTLTLALNLQGRTEPDVEDNMTIDLYDDPCLAAIAALGSDYDFDENCIRNLEDFSVISATWQAGSELAYLAAMASKGLVDYTLTAPVPKP